MTAAPAPFPLAGTLGTFAGRVPRVLVTDAARHRLGSAVGGLPASLASAVYLECRLAPGEGQVDAILRVEREGAAIVAGRNPVIRLPEELTAAPAWERIACLCRRWLDGRTESARRIDHLWLEFDLEPGSQDTLPPPSVFVGLAAAGAEHACADGWLRLLDEVTADLAPDGPCPGGTAALRRVLAARPPGTRSPYLGLMLARPGAAVRVYFAGVPEEALPALLGDAGWGGSTARLAEALVRAGPGRPRVSMAHLDVHGEVLPRVGIEYALRRRPQLRGTVAEDAFLDGLVEAGLCAGPKRAGLLEWPGCTRDTLPHELWPSLQLRRVNCVKLVHDQDRGGVEAKAYLLACSHPTSVRRAGPPRPEPWSPSSTG